MAKSTQVARELTYAEEIAKEEAEAAAAEAVRNAEIQAESQMKAALAQAATTDPQAAINHGILSLLTKLLDRQEKHTGPTPQIPFAQYKQKTTWNPTGEKHRRALKRPTFLNGHRLREKMLSQTEIDLLNQVKPGSYNGRKWTVIEQSTSENGAGALKIFFPNKTPEQRMALLEEGRSLVELLNKIIREQEAVVLAA
jgi:hypothetical protein